MNNLLWRYYHEDDIERFRYLLATASYASKSHGSVSTGSVGALGSSPGGSLGSPKTNPKARKASSAHSNNAGNARAALSLSRADLNGKDCAGLTLLHRCAASNAPNATSYAVVLINHPLIDLDLQDPESGWTALHRALYFGNIRIAYAIIERDAKDRSGQDGSLMAKTGASIIKIEDHEGNTPFDVYNATIARRSLELQQPTSLTDSESEDEAATDSGASPEGLPFNPGVDGDEVFAFGSNKNFSLGFADQDDRQYPEKVTLKRPDHLYLRFYQEYLQINENSTTHKQTLPNNPKVVSDLPSVILGTSIVIQDIRLSKLHSAILTTDPESNLYMCGFGPGGRLGLGDETTRFTYHPVNQGALSGKKVAEVALGQNHTLAISTTGEIYSWGVNTFGQLGYSLSIPKDKNEDPSCSTPRQIFGPLKREAILGIAASALHSVAFTSTSLYCWGKNEGQLGLMDSSSRSREAQLAPRKVAASLFHSPISMVSAINTATICLLADHTVCVFTNYGYNIVKFPFDESFSNYHFQSTRSTRYDGGASIISIESGGDTIAAISSRGDLYTMTVRKPYLNDVAASTTNPNKIKSALSAPQRIWSLRKGNWDGVKSVGIGENASVIVCTQAGAVWRQVRRMKAKDAFNSTSQKQKDWKFQRVSNLTKVAAVRSTPYGTFAAIRKDCDVAKTQIQVGEQTLWHDVKPLFCLENLEISSISSDDETEQPRFWIPALPKEHFEDLKRSVLTSLDLEADVERHCMVQKSSEYDIELSSSTCTVHIPIHGFLFMGRSQVMRRFMDGYTSSANFPVPGILHVEKILGDRLRVVFEELDVISLVNLASYIYTDTVLDVWNFTKHNQSMAYRYRQSRIELMKIATCLQMPGLEASVRLMTESSPRLSLDMSIAIERMSFFEGGDTIVELDGSELPIHSTMFCQRCPFFQALFKGRAGGQWLTERRQNQIEPVRVDLKHISPFTFKLVLRYIYADAGIELFDDVVSADIDEFSEIILDVLAAANELMLDRLSQICQKMLGQFVTTRNVGQILNAVGPCSVTTFKDAALEYVCLQLEAMLENHFLEGLDNDLFSELDLVVKANQLNCLPFVKSGRAEILLYERHPDLATDIDEERQRRLREALFKSNLRSDENRLSTSFRPRIGSLEDHLSPSSHHDLQRSSKGSQSASPSPNLRPMASKPDLMFAMDEESSLTLARPQTPKDPATPQPQMTPSRSPQFAPNDRSADIIDDARSSSISSPVGLGIRKRSGLDSTTPTIWSAPLRPPDKVDMREIMAQASSTSPGPVAITRSSAEKMQNESSSATATPKLSQRERKKQQQAMLKSPSVQQSSPGVDAPKFTSPWQVASTGLKTNLRDLMDGEGSPPPMSALKPVKSPDLSTISVVRRTASPDTRFAGQRRPTTRTKSSTPAPPHSTSSAIRSNTNNESSPLLPHSERYLPPAAEPALQLSLKDIIGQQEREIEVRKEAVAKRSLQEIQEEQAFQEWWDEESKKVKEAEESVREKERRRASNSSREKGNERARGSIRGSARGLGRGRGRVTGTEKALDDQHICKKGSGRS